MRRLVESIRLSGPIWKPALAAGLAWTLAVPTGTHRPYFAPLAAILSMQVTVEESLWRGYQRVVGIVGGIVIADVVARHLGVHAWSLALLVLAGTALATWLKLGVQAIPQVAVSAMLVMVLGTGHQDYALDRIADSVIGVITAVLVNMLVIPPDFTGKAELAIARSAAQLAHHLRHQADITGSGDTPSADQQPVVSPELSDLHNARQAVQTGLQALRFSPLVRHRRARLNELDHDMRTLSEAYEHIVVLDDMLAVCRADPDWSLAERAHWSAQLNDVADVIDHWEATPPADRGSIDRADKYAPMTTDVASAALTSGYHQLRRQFTGTGTQKPL